MKLVKVEINDFKGCQKTILEIGTSLTALIGVNGSGKTTILTAINFLKDAINQRFYHEPSDENLSTTILNLTFEDGIGKINLRATIKYDFGMQSSDEISELFTEWRIPEIAPRKWIKIPIEILNRSIFKNFEINAKRGRTFSKITLERFVEIRDLLTEETLSRLFRISDFLRSITYYSATQFSEPARSPMSIKLEDGNRGGYYRNYRNRNLQASLIIDLFKLKKDDPIAFESYMNLVGPIGIGLIDDIEFEEVNFKSEEVKVRSGGKVSTETRTTTIIVPKLLIGKNVLSFNQLSEGTLKTVSLLFYIMRESASMLLIEEPEVCVHHGLLASIVEVIKRVSKDKQILITTHSDLVLDKLKPENLVVVTKHAETGIQAKKLSKLLSKDNYRALHEYLLASGNLGEYWKEGGFDE